jgi:predicted glycoside hydrolase/deacetylase ChbG (UPF0249 family)
MSPRIKSSQWLIVNADDLGYTEATTAGILHAHSHGIVTSASLMVRRPAARTAARQAAAAGLDDLGLHLDLGEWVFRDGDWRPLYEVVDRGDASAVAAECQAQLEQFRDLVGRNPTHLDSHQHTHLDEPVRSIAVALAAELGVPLRHLSPAVVHCGGFYGQSGRGEPAPELLTTDWLLELLHRDHAAAAGQRPAAVELGCHPGWDDALDTMYRAERKTEVEVLCSSGLPEAIAALGFEFATFAAVVAGPTPEPRT